MSVRLQGLESTLLCQNNIKLSKHRPVNKKLDLLRTGHCAINKPNERVMQQSKLSIPCLEQRKLTLGVMLLESPLEKESFFSSVVASMTLQFLRGSETLHVKLSVSQVCTQGHR